ncbi:hypothetical protein WICMUC_003023 [Wickerhamomyces mucosus]|uniref:Rhomboid-type serine protease 2 n=1 Tax=Wickerhamomyces mucosus TaxID=1378264 RepID=A0A9P8PNP3_9ASCO|nr:hypothetical protein WICMUC_003023 [Wickerhamomyces mucosus]
MSLNNFNLSSIRKYFPIEDDYPPALTIGLVVFLTFIYILSFFTPINEAIYLTPTALTQLDLNRISLYPLGHLSIFHLVFNLFAIVTPLSLFEKKHGTVYTGVILNLLAVATAVLYSILGLVFYPNAKVVGASAWVFSFSGFFAYKESLIKPTFQISPSYSLPTVATPLIPLVLIAILVPGSSLLGHLFGLVAGYALAYGLLNILVPPSKVIEWIEEKVDKLISLIPSQFKYYKEIDAKFNRSQDEYVSFLQTDILPTTNEPESNHAGSFQGEGQVLGA